MRAIELTAYGETSGLRAVETVEPAGPAADEVLIEMEYAPVHQTDLFVIRGAFAVHPDLPSPIGNEGVGRVAAVGSGVTNVKVGDRVLPPLYSLTWREKLVVKAAGLTALPEAVDAQQLATLRINPVTAALLLSEYVPLKKNDWVLQNAGNSGVGLAVSAIAKSRGFNVISLVRSADRIPDALLTGADAAFVDDESAAAKIADTTQGASVRLGLDAVGGAAAGRLVGLLSPGSTLVGYGLMGGDLISPVNVLDLIYKDIAYRGFYQARTEYDHLIPGVLKESAELMEAGKLRTPVDAIYSIDDVTTAVEHVMKGGKVLLRLRANQ